MRRWHGSTLCDAQMMPSPKLTAALTDDSWKPRKADTPITDVPCRRRQAGGQAGEDRGRLDGDGRPGCCIRCATRMYCVSKSSAVVIWKPPRQREWAADSICQN